MYCPQCGSQNPDNAQFCGGCGAKLPAPAPAPPVAPVPPQPVYVPPPTTPPPAAPVAYPTPQQPMYQAPPQPPLPGYGRPAQAPSNAAATQVPSHMVMSVIATICCGCFPLGVVAIIYAAQCKGRLQAGDIAGAQHASARAKMWAIIAMILGAIAIAIGSIITIGKQQGLFKDLFR
jgi:hypothetical protein